MKKITFILFAFITGTTFAQDAQATATASAGVVSALTIQKDTDLYFGSMTGAVGNTNKTIIIPFDGSPITATGVTFAGGAVLETDSEPHRATFLVGASEGVLFNVTVPSTELVLVNPNATPTASDWKVTAFQGPADETTVGGGATEVTIGVGATLTTGDTMDEGLYTAEFPVTVAYQ